MTLEEVLINYFDWTQEEIEEKQNVLSYVSNDGDAAIKKAEFYQKEFDLTKDEFTKMVKTFPTLLGLAEETIKAKAGFYQNEFNLTKTEFIKMIKTSPALLGCLEKSIKTKVKFYQSEFNITKTEFVKMLKTLPALLGLAEETIKEKTDFYQNEFNITRADFIKMIKKLPALLSYSEESVKEKHQQMIDLKLPNNYIVENPNIVIPPVNTLKIRYAILRNVASREEILSKSNWYMTSQDKTYARLVYFLNQKNNVAFNNLFKSETAFEKRYKVSSDDLMKEYKLTESDLMMMLSLVEEEMAELTKEEKEYIQKEYGE